MKTVKRKAEVGEKVRSLKSGRVGTVVDVSMLQGHVKAIADTGDTFIQDPENYEVIIEDEPEIEMTEELEKKRRQLERNHGGSVRFIPDTDNLPPHSSHYHPGNIDVIRFAEENFSVEERRGFYRMSALKYLTRFDRKGSPLDDLEKAQFYTGKLKELEGAE